MHQNWGQLQHVVQLLCVSCATSAVRGREPASGSLQRVKYAAATSVHAGVPATLASDLWYSPIAPNLGNFLVNRRQRQYSEHNRVVLNLSDTADGNRQHRYAQLSWLAGKLAAALCRRTITLRFWRWWPGWPRPVARSTRQLRSALTSQPGRRHGAGTGQRMTAVVRQRRPCAGRCA